MFRATVPATVRVLPDANDVEPLDHVVVMELDVVDGRLVCTRCTVEMGDNRQGVTAEALRRIPVGRYLREAAAAHPFTVLEVDPNNADETMVFDPPPANFADEGMTEEVLRQVARLYHWALATGDAPLGLLERDYGIPRGKASRWISTARRRGYVKDAPRDVVEDLGTMSANPRFGSDGS